MWQVYAKMKNVWVAIGEPITEDAARRRVKGMLDNGRWNAPHCVPLH